VNDAVVEKIAFLLGCQSSDVDLNTPVVDLGIDSLAAVELSNWITSDYRANVGQTEILSGMTTRLLVDALLADGSPVSEALADDDDDDDGDESSEEEEMEDSSESDSSEDDHTNEGVTLGSDVDVRKEVMEKIAFLLGCQSSDVDDATPLTDLGIDSLAAVELSNWVQSWINVTISQTDVLSGITGKGMIQFIEQSAAASGPKKSKKQKKEKKQKPKKEKKDAKPVPSKTSSPPSTGPSSSSSSPKPSASKSPAPSTSTGDVVHIKFEQDKFDRPLLTHILESVESAASTENAFAIIIQGDSLGMDLERFQFGSREMDEGTRLLRLPKPDFYVFGFVFGFDCFSFCCLSCFPFEMTLCSRICRFCSHGSLSALLLFSRIYEAIRDCAIPIIYVASGSIRGGGMLFPCAADVVLALNTASFGFPEIRRGAVPGIVR